MTSLTMEVGKAAGREAPRRRAVQELLRPRASSAGSTAGPSSRTLDWIDEALRRQPPWCSTPTPGPSRPATTSARRPSSSSRTTRSARPPSSPASTPTSPATPPWPGGSSPPPTRPICPLFLGSYPITPASDILHELSKHKQFGVRTFQAEDEIAGVGAAIGAAFGGSLGVTTTSGPGHRPQVGVRSGMAVSLELPLLVIDIQRGGPSTGLPTKTEQSDLLHAMYGRHGEAPVPIVAAMTPSHCFDAAIEAVRIAVTYRTPVILLSDGYLANGAEPWRLPDVADAARPPRRVRHRDQPHRRRRHRRLLALRPRRGDPGPALGRPRHARARAPHRRPREGRTARATSPTTRTTTSAWSTSAPPRWPASPRTSRPSRSTTPTGSAAPPCSSSAGGRPTAPSPPACAGCGPGACRWPTPTWSTSTPSPPTSARCSRAYDKVLVPEANLGQLAKLVRADFLVDARTLSKVQGVALPGGARSKRPSSRCSGADDPAPPPTKRTWPADDRHRDPRHDPQGLDLGPGGPLVPGVRRLLDPGRRADAHARARACAARTPCSCPASAARPASRTT